MDIDNELQRADDLANLRVELPCDEWLALTVDEQQIMRHAAIRNGYHLRRLGGRGDAIAEQLEHRGYLSLWVTPTVNRDAYYLLTWRGFRIIPVSLIEG